MNRFDRAARWIALVALGMTVAALTGRLAPHTVNDTHSYVDFSFASLQEVMTSIRTPGYPLLVRIVDSAFGLDWMPEIHVLLHATACWLLFNELTGRGMSSMAATVASICVLLGCTAADNINTISTDAPAASLGVMTASLLMRSSRTARTTDWCLCFFTALVAIFVRPAYLFLVPWLAIAGWMLGRHDEVVFGAQQPAVRRSRWAGTVVAAAVAVVVFGWMGARKAVVNDFGLLPFGHQNLSALLVQTVPLETLRSLEGDGGELAERVADELQEQGFESPGESGGGLPTLTIESQWDLINYHVILPIARDMEKASDFESGEAAIRIHKRIGEMNRQIVAESPGGYVRWLALAVRRALWGVPANIAMHPLFGAAIILLSTWFCIRCSSGRPLGPLVIQPGWMAFALIGISYAAMKIGFVILSSPPIGRFADAGAIFLPAIIFSLFVKNTD